jgi:uncharacterized protein YyaL (SSP411 family)
MGRPTNRLGSATSPYLLQHAHNPVDWFPWGEEAFAKARQDDKPIFLSVGYAACHWCHVMERESFEDPTIAALLNQHFVSIKVDREERPDVDALYMDAVQAMNRGQGGWPMSVFLTPDGDPFFAGTYFPPEPRFGTPSFRLVLEGLREAWAGRRDDVRAQASNVVDVLRATVEIPTLVGDIDRAITDDALASLRSTFDARSGGFGGAPKFPQPMVLEFLLRMATREAVGAIEMLTFTLDRMAEGGIRDQLSGGFSRYSTDALWHVPHFEKMLYDNAQLALVYGRASMLSGSDRYRDVATAILDELLRDMQHPEGGFASSQDADSEGVEGKYFTWSWDELVRIAGASVATAFGASPDGNWEGEAGRTNVLWRPRPLAEVADDVGVDADELAQELAAAIPRLRAVRDRRVRPAVDDKIVTAWNALAIRAFAEVGVGVGGAGYVREAERCATFVWEHLRDDRGRLLRSWRNGTTSGPAFADDHALLALAFLSLYEATADPRWFARSREIAESLLDLFSDDAGGGFYHVGRDVPPLRVRQKDVYDNATPSATSAAAEMLLRMSMFTADRRYEDRAVSALRSVGGLLRRAPQGFGHALSALDLLIGPRAEVAIVGPPRDPSRRELESVVREKYRPNIVLAVSGGRRDEEIVPLLRHRVAVDGLPTAYVCVRHTCRLPVRDAEGLRRDLLTDAS